MYLCVEKMDNTGILHWNEISGVLALGRGLKMVILIQNVVNLMCVLTSDLSFK